MLAMNLRAPRADRYTASSLTTIVVTPPGACSLQGIEVHPSKSGRLSGRLAFVFDLGAPLTTLAERRHCAVGKPAGRRFSRAGPRMAHRGDPRSNAGERACRALARHRVVGQSLLLPFCWAGTPAFEKGSRRKGETISGRYRSNGYVLGQHNTTQHNTTQHNTTQHNTTQLRSASATD